MLVMPKSARSRCWLKWRVRRIVRPPAWRMKKRQGQEGEEIAEEDDLAGGMAVRGELHQRVHAGEQQDASSMNSMPRSMSPRDGAEAIESKPRAEAAGLEKGRQRQENSPLSAFRGAPAWPAMRGPAIADPVSPGPGRGLAEGRQSPRLPAGLGGGQRGDRDFGGYRSGRSARRDQDFRQRPGRAFAPWTTFRSPSGRTSSSPCWAPRAAARPPCCA